MPCPLAPIRFQPDLLFSVAGPPLPSLPPRTALPHYCILSLPCSCERLLSYASISPSALKASSWPTPCLYAPLSYKALSNSSRLLFSQHTPPSTLTVTSFSYRAATLSVPSTSHIQPHPLGLKAPGLEFRTILAEIWHLRAHRRAGMGESGKRT